MSTEHVAAEIHPFDTSGIEVGSDGIRRYTAPDVLEVAVVGVPDPVMGEKVGAVVLGKPGTEPHQVVASSCEFARERLADFTCLQFVRVQGSTSPRPA